ncbi:unnamed protein product [Closterium sp. Yama58-4]|nr:unnamed protein product [Closterium sp. Yama58-4]
MAIHWRRTDLIKSFKDPLSHLTVEQTGRCVARKMIRSGNLTTLFLATDTNDEEVNELEKIMRIYIPNLRLVRQPTFLTGEDWAAVLAQAHFTHMFTVQAMLDKVICAMADVFSGTDASSFSLDITRIRAGLRFQVCDDTPICQGQALVADDARTTEGGKSEGGGKGPEGTSTEGGSGGVQAGQEGSTVTAGEVGATNRPIRTDWVKPVSKEEKDEAARRKVAAGVCDKAQNYGKLYGMGPIAWEPQPGKYVLMDCYRNQMSNRVRCMNKYLLAAGYLNRTLVVPLHADEISRNYERRAYFDLNHTRRCYGPRTVISRDELLELEKGAGGSDTHMPNYTSIGFSPNLTWTSGGFLSSHAVNITDFRLVDSMLRPEARLITFDDLGSAILDASMQANGSRMNNLELPFIRSPGCPNPLAIQPHPAILEAADAFVRTKVLQGLPREWEVKNGSSNSSSGEGEGGRLAFGRYMAVHWRRTDLIKNYAHLTVEQTGSCVARKMIRSGNLTTLFLATDTNDEEVKQLEQVIRASIPNLRLVRQPTSLAGEGWAAVLAQAHFTHMTTVQAVLDKAICVMADVFLGTDASSFTADINRIRAGLRYQECDDTSICHGLPVVGNR